MIQSIVSKCVRQGTLIFIFALLVHFVNLDKAEALPTVHYIGQNDDRISSVYNVEIGSVFYTATFHHGSSFDDLSPGFSMPFSSSVDAVTANALWRLSLPRRPGLFPPLKIHTQKHITPHGHCQHPPH